MKSHTMSAPSLLLAAAALLALTHCSQAAPGLHHESAVGGVSDKSSMALSELGSHVAARVSPHSEQRLPLPLSLPSSSDLESIKKVAQILVMLGEQVIPTIIGQPMSGGGGGAAALAAAAGCEPQLIAEVANDLVDN